MNTLEEVEVEGCPDIKAYNFKCDDIIDSDIPPPLPGSNEGWFRIGIIGKSGSGKTNIIRCLTERMGKNQIYCRRFTNVFYLSPSVKTMDKKPKLDKGNFYTDLERDLPIIVDRIQNETDKEGRSLIIMDDISHQLKAGGQEEVKKLFQNNRHLGRPLLNEEGEQIESGAVSTIIIAQRLNNLPRHIRSQITHWIIFDPRNTKSELETIFNELIHCDKNIYNELLNRTFSKPYNFLFIDTNKSKIYNGFDKEFKVNINSYL
jgi:GTPase SAR1 family protein